jgi:hypothetical protein
VLRRARPRKCQKSQQRSGAEAMARDPSNAGAIVFKRSGDPAMGGFSDAVVLKTFGEIPDRLDEL